MALTNCPQCGKPLSSEASSCPHCGRPLEALEVTCPKCGSGEIGTAERGISMMWGVLGAKTRVNVCKVCGHKWRPSFL